MTKQLVTIITAVMTTLLALFVAWQFRIVAVYVLISVTLAAALHPLVNHLVGRKFIVRGAWILLYLAVLGSAGFIIFLAAEAAVNEIQRLAYTMSVQDQWTLPVWFEGTSFQQTILAWLPPPGKLFEAVTGDKGQLVLPAVLGFTQDFASLVSDVIVVLFLSIYWAINQNHFERLWLSLLPSGQRKQARDIWHTIELDLGAYIRSQVVHSLLAGLLLGLGYWAIGSPYPSFLALSAALACLIPVIGMPLAIIPVLLVGLLTGVQLSVLTVLYTLMILIALGIWVRPRLFNRRWDNPILTLVILIAMASAFGLLGMIIAPPIAAVCQILWKLLVIRRLASGSTDKLANLKDRQEQVWAKIKALDGSPLPLATSSIERLNRLIVRAEPLLQAAEVEAVPESRLPAP